MDESSLSQQLRVVDSLRPTQNFFSSHKHVVGVGQFLTQTDGKEREREGLFSSGVSLSLSHTHRVVGVRHGVEWPHSQWVLVQDVEISVILQVHTYNGQMKQLSDNIPVDHWLI